MRRLRQFTTSILVLALFAAPAFADTLTLKSGEKISGYFEGGSARVIKFRLNDGLVKDYDILTVQQIQFGDDKTTSSLTPASRPATSSAPADPRLVPGTERVTRPASPNAANTGYTIATGSKVVIRMIDSVNSETNKVGETFIAVLDEPISQGGVEVIPRGTRPRPHRQCERGRPNRRLRGVGT